MKASVSVSKSRKSVVIIEFDKEIPIFPEPAGGWPTSRHKNLIFDRTCSLDTYALSMAFENQGAFQVELAGKPIDIYCDFLNDLICIPGVIGVVAANRYEIFAAVGIYFDHRIVGERIARQFRKHFYPDELLNMKATSTSLESQTD